MNREETIKRIVLPFYNKSLPVRFFNEPVLWKLKIRFRPLQHLLSIKPLTQMLFMVPSIKKALFHININERILEIPFVFEQLKLPLGSNILDFGCAASPISFFFAEMGYKVTGADLRSYQLSHPNFKLLKGDFLSKEVTEGSFDGIVCVSAIEHVGLDKYGSETYEKGDIAIMKKFRKTLRKRGRLILTVPYGKKEASYWMKVYDYESLHALFDGFTITEERYYEKKDPTTWQPADPRLLEERSSVKELVGVALISAEKA